MSIITINGVKVYSANIDNISSISFDYLNNKVYSAEKIQKMIGVFVSSPIEGTDDVVRWAEVSWVAQKYDKTDVYVYIKSSTTISGLDSAIWNGPYLNDSNDISSLVGGYLQFMIVLLNNGAVNTNYEYIVSATTPIFSSIDLSYYSSSGGSKFYSRTFDLGFVPKHILLTYNGNVSDDSIIRFAVSGFDSVDSSDYQYIDPNKIEELSELSILSNKIKLMIEMIGDNNVPITIHEVALMFSGEQQKMVNDMSSSSESISSSSSDT